MTESLLGFTMSRKSLVEYSAVTAEVGWLVTCTWRYSGEVMDMQRTADGREVPLFRSVTYDETAPPVEMVNETFAAFRRVWGK